MLSPCAPLSIGSFETFGAPRQPGRGKGAEGDQQSVGPATPLAARLAGVEGMVERMKAVPEGTEPENARRPGRSHDGDRQGDPEGKDEGAHVADVVGVLDPVLADLVDEAAGRVQRQFAG